MEFSNDIIAHFFPQLTVSSDELEVFKKYLQLKGINRYRSLYNMLIDNNVQEVSYKVLSEHYRYDVKLRRALYKIIAFVEIAMRSAISNTYGDTLITDNWKSEISNTFMHNYSPSKKVCEKIAFIIRNAKEDEESLTLSDLLERCDMQVLNEIFILLDQDKQRGVFSNDFNHLAENLNAMRKVRNCVGHHHILLIQDLNDVWINGQKKAGIQANIENIINISPDIAKDNLKRLINDCLIIDENEERTNRNTYMILPSFMVYFEEV